MNRISADTELVILDMYDTLVRYDTLQFWVPRRGRARFLSGLQDKIVVVSSDEFEERLELDLEDCRDQLSGVYGHKHMVLDDKLGLKHKDVGRILKDAGVGPEKAVFIGDNMQGVDEYSAKKFEVPFILVPRHYDKPKWSLASLLPQKKSR